MEKREVMFAVLFATSVLVLLAFFLLFFFVRYRYKSNQYISERQKLKVEYEQALLQAQIEVHENTLSSLGYELHDNIGQLLSSTKMLLGVLQRTMKEVPETLNIAEETLGKAIGEVRSLSKSLDKEWLQQFNLIENLQTEVHRINAAKGLQIHFTHCENIFLTTDKQLILFRIIQEALQNAIKHSGAENIYIEIINDNDDLIINVIDNGKGFEDIVNPSAGLGLKNMKHRTTLLGGNIEWSSESNKGVTVIINLSFKEKEV
jgi:signal transduction histidine kinase